MSPAVFLGVSGALGGLAGMLLVSRSAKGRGLIPAVSGTALAGLVCGIVVGLALDLDGVSLDKLWGVAGLLAVLAFLAGRLGVRNSRKSGVALGRELFLWVFFFELPVLLIGGLFRL